MKFHKKKLHQRRIRILSNFYEVSQDLHQRRIRILSHFYEVLQKKVPSKKNQNLIKLLWSFTKELHQRRIRTLSNFYEVSQKSSIKEELEPYQTSMKFHKRRIRTLSNFYEVLQKSSVKEELEPYQKSSIKEVWQCPGHGLELWQSPGRCYYPFTPVAISKKILFFIIFHYFYATLWF